MKFLITLMRSSLMISKTVSAIGMTIVVSYGIYEFIKRNKKDEK